jgi:nucleotide-binding universal stress UspA family protein
MSPAVKPALDRVLVAIDFSDASIAAARWTADHFAPSAEIILAHVIEPPPATRASVMRFPSMETIVNKAHVEVEARLAELCKSVSPDRARAEIRVGIPHDELVFLTSQTGSDLIVVGRQDLASSGWARVGATAQRVIRKSTAPILLVAGAESHTPDRLLVAVDESDMTDNVLTWGTFLVSRFTARGILMHAAGSEEQEDSGEWMSAESAKIAGATSLEQLVTRSSVRPAESIIAEAKRTRAELVVIGSRGAGGANQMLFGTVAEAILLSAPCPVLVVLPPS